MEQRAQSGFEWRKGAGERGAGESGRGTREEEAGGPWGTGPAGSREGSPQPSQALPSPQSWASPTPQPFTIVDGALDMESWAETDRCFFTGLSHSLSEPQILRALLASKLSGDQNLLQFNCIKSESLK